MRAWRRRLRMVQNCLVADNFASLGPARCKECIQRGSWNKDCLGG